MCDETVKNLGTRERLRRQAWTAVMPLVTETEICVYDSEYVGAHDTRSTGAPGNISRAAEIASITSERLTVRGKSGRGNVCAATASVLTTTASSIESAACTSETSLRIDSSPEAHSTSPARVQVSIDM